jgi:glycosyltransferase involved in cell wall biosynthesis
LSISRELNGGPIRVVHLINALAIGGAEMSLAGLVQRMDRNVFSSAVIALGDPEPLGATLRRSGIPVFTLGMRPGVPDPRAFARLVRLLLKLHPDVLQTWLYHADLMGVLAGKLLGVAAICCSIHAADIELTQYSWLSRTIFSLLKRLANLPSCVISVSRSAIAWHERMGYHPRRWEYIPVGCDTERFRPRLDSRYELRSELGLDPDVLLIGLVARLHPWKDHANFLKAFAILKSFYPDVHAILVGRDINWKCNELVDLIHRNQLGGGVHLLDERTDIERIMSALDVFCLSSYTECSPTVISEAMSSGVPCVATDVGDCAAIVGATGKVVPTRNPEGLAAALQGLIELSSEERQKLGEAARLRVLENFTLTKIIRQHEELYMELTRANVRRRRLF